MTENSEEVKSAIALLLAHGVGGRWLNGEELKDDGFIGVLRPYIGLNKDNYREVARAMIVLVLQKKVLSGEAFQWASYAIFGVLHFSRRWGLDPDGMLQRNAKISPQDTAILRSWVVSLERLAFEFFKMDKETSGDAISEIIKDIE